MGKPEHDFHLVNPSPIPFLASIATFTMFLGLLFLMHGAKAGGINLGYIVFPLGFLAVLSIMYWWWKDVIHEAIHDKIHTKVVQHGLRLGMALFIISEVMFFFAFFWSFFKSALDPVLVFEGLHLFESTVEPMRGVFPPESIDTFDPWDLPFMNTLILLLSGTTVTWAHYALLQNDQKGLVQGLAFSVGLGFFFTIMQIVEYSHAPFGFNDSNYSSNFYMATGFHGFHVFIGTLFLLVCLLRARKQAYTPEHHLGFEFAAWYWHFVDVIWLFLFAFVYVWGE